MIRQIVITAALLACSAPQIAAQQCEYSHNREVIDLSPLTKTSEQDGYYEVNSTEYTSYKFLFNICGPIGWQDYASPNVCPSGQTGSCEVQVHGDRYLVSDNYGASQWWTIEHQDGENGQPPGPVLTMNATECSRLQDGTKVQTKIYLVCDEAATTPVVTKIRDSYWECYVHIQMRTSLICSHGPGHPTIPPGGHTRPDFCNGACTGTQECHGNMTLPDCAAWGQRCRAAEGRNCPAPPADCFHCAARAGDSTDEGTSLVLALSIAAALAVFIAVVAALILRRRRRRGSAAYQLLEMSDIQGSQMAAPRPTEVFLSHNWGDDDLGRDNHDRVVEINAMLTAAGYVTWCDSEQMIGDVVERMVEGIDNTQVVLVFVTRRYMEKVGLGAGVQDNCKKEFKYSVRRHSDAKMIPVIMEPGMKDSSKWTGPLAMELGGTLWVDQSDTVLNSGSEGFGRLRDEINGRLPGRAGPGRASLVEQTPVAPAHGPGNDSSGDDDDDDMIDIG